MVVLAFAVTAALSGSLKIQELKVASRIIWTLSCEVLTICNWKQHVKGGLNKSRIWLVVLFLITLEAGGLYSVSKWPHLMDIPQGDVASIKGLQPSRSALVKSVAASCISFKSSHGLSIQLPAFLNMLQLVIESLRMCFWNLVNHSRNLTGPFPVSMAPRPRVGTNERAKWC